MEVKLLRVTKRGVDLVAEAARISGVASAQGATEIVEQITYNDYSSALEHIYFTFDIAKISVALSRELLEHRIASHTARSTRYKEEKGFDYYLPPELVRSGNAAGIFHDAMKSANDSYLKLRELGVAREEARYVLPIALHTHYVVTMNVRSLINFFMLRLCVRASPEMRTLAMHLYKLCRKEYPEIFLRVWCRGYTLGVCPENEVRPKDCPFRKILPEKREIRDKFEEQAKNLIEKELERLIADIAG
ncbi:MAG: FAD-dependent thymidylate synthase [Halobacteriota archaeon]